MWVSDWASNEARMLVPVAVVKQPKLFRLFISWPGEACSIPDSPHCEVTRVRENWRSDGQVWPEGFVLNI